MFFHYKRSVLCPCSLCRGEAALNVNDTANCVKISTQRTFPRSSFSTLDNLGKVNGCFLISAANNAGFDAITQLNSSKVNETCSFILEYVWVLPESKFQSTRDRGITYWHSITTLVCSSAVPEWFSPGREKKQPFCTIAVHISRTRSLGSLKYVLCPTPPDVEVSDGILYQSCIAGAPNIHVYFSVRVIPCFLYKTKSVSINLRNATRT